MIARSMEDGVGWTKVRKGAHSSVLVMGGRRERKRGSIFTKWKGTEPT